MGAFSCPAPLDITHRSGEGLTIRKGWGEGGRVSRATTRSEATSAGKDVM